MRPVSFSTSASESRYSQPSFPAANLPVVVFPAPIMPTRRIRSVIASWRVVGVGTDRARDGVVPKEAMNPSRFRTSSANESPPNLRSASEASTRAVMVSATTPMAGTAVTSVRSRKLTVDSLVTTSTVSRTGRLRVARGFMATRATRRAPLEMPPSMPPARSVGRT